jgi:uncharacterized protein YdbL (DUF1318 family)
MRWIGRFGAIVLLAAGLGIGPAQAGALEDAKAEGLVGERVDGYLGVVDSGAPGSVKSMVNEINAEREAKYAQIAKKQDAPTSAVAQIAGEKLVKRAPKGEYVMGASGKWQKK